MMNHQPTHKGCNSSTCCSPAKIWRTVQEIVKNDNKKGLIELFTHDKRLEHIVRVILSSRITNDPKLLPPSQKHQIIKLNDTKGYLGTSFNDLNLLQLALIKSSESTVLTLLNYLKLNTTTAELKQFLNHIWGQGNTSLHLASFLKRSNVIKFLLEFGCAQVKNQKQKLPVDCCQGDSVVMQLFCPAEEKVAIISKPKELETTKSVTATIITTTITTTTSSSSAITEKFTNLSVLKQYPAYSFIVDKKHLALFVQPNQCIILAQHKKPPDINCNTILSF